MTELPVQNFENHVRHDKVLYINLLIFLGGAIAAAAALFAQPVKCLAISAILIAAGGILVAVNARTYSIKVQNRVIRLEMRLRLAGLLEADLADRIPEFTLRQLAAMRFASDEELPILTRRVLEENLTDSKVIKKSVQSWQADHLRV